MVVIVTALGCPALTHVFFFFFFLRGSGKSGPLRLVSSLGLVLQGKRAH